ncbi:MAG: cupin domain-containing protein [Planctomycetia bacterium]|nr:cupin domain-containing protein [Planctomycetia bacterium]
MVKILDKPIQYPQDDISIDEFVGKISTGNSDVSIARIQCAANWSEPDQTPEFDEYVFVISGVLCVTPAGKAPVRIEAGKMAHIPKGETIHYWTPSDCPADYVAICLPAFGIETAHRNSCS